jgi:hypothetical protein
MSMAKMVEDTVVVRVTRLVKDDEVATALFDEAVVEQLEAVINELVSDPKAMIEIIQA